MKIDSKLSDDNSIIFTNPYAVDYTELVNIELSLDEKNGFIETTPFDLWCKLSQLNHIQIIISIYFYSITKIMPHIADKDKYKLFYRCYKRYSHTHDMEIEYTELSIDKAIELIKDENYSIGLPNIKGL